MEISYWKSRWRKNHIGWHMDQVYPHLQEYWPRLQLKYGATVLVPLCGKSLDMLWLEKQNLDVIGVEVSEKAARNFFNEHQIPYKKLSKAFFTIYHSENLSIWVGDFFKLKPVYLPKIDIIYDKAALIALPKEQRQQYAIRVLDFCKPNTQILLNTFEYEQDEMNGPPFSVSKEELKQLYGQQFSIELLHEESIFDSLSKFQARGLSSYLIEKLYYLKQDLKAVKILDIV